MNTSSDQGSAEQSTRLSILNDQWGVARWELEARPDVGPVLVVTLDDGRVAEVERDGQWYYR